MNIADGKKIRETIKESLKNDIIASGRAYRLAVVYAGSDPVIDRFVEAKKKFGEEIGVVVEVFRFGNAVRQDELIENIVRIGRDAAYQGIIVQLPLPARIDADAVLNAVPAEKDIDVLSFDATRKYASGTLPFIPAVPGAISEILRAYNMPLDDKKAVVVGVGRLVGLPVRNWLQKNGIFPKMIDEYTRNISVMLADADIIISGAGSPHFIKPDMVKDRVVLIDVGTSEQGGKLVGDIDPACSEKASLFAAVPGGVGPITIAILFRNLLATQVAR